MAAKKSAKEKSATARARHARWLAKNPDYDRQRYANDAERRAANIASARQSRETDPERHAAYQRDYAERHREIKRQKTREWRLANPERARANESARRARLLGAYVEDVAALVVLERADGACGICGDDVDPLHFHVDHVVPLIAGGEHSYANVQLAHPLCNQRKGGRHG